MGRAISAVIIVLLALLLVVSCQGNDPFGATTREQVRSEAAVAIAQIEADASIRQTAIEADAAKTTTLAWTQTVVVLALILTGGVLGGLIVYFQGKAYLVSVKPSSPALLDLCDPASLLKHHAARSNLLLDRVGGNYLLTDPTTGKRIRVLPRQRP